MSEGITRLAVGEQFAPGVTYGDTERFEYRYSNGQHILQMNMPNLNEKEIQAFRTGQVHVGLYALRGTIFFLFKIADFMDWSDQSFSLFALPESERQLEALRPDEHILLKMVLIDSPTGIIKALRVITYSAHMTEVFTRLLHRQAADGLPAEQHDANVTEAYRRFPHSRMMVKAALCTERAGLRQAGERGAS